MQVDKNEMEQYLARLEELESEDMVKLVEKHLDDDAVELICQHIEDFYGIDDDEEIGHLAQLMVAGFVMGREIS